MKKTFSKILSATLSAVLLIPLLLSCSGEKTVFLTTKKAVTKKPATTKGELKVPDDMTPAELVSSFLERIAETAANDLVNNYWVGESVGGYVANVETQRVWRPGRMILALETMYDATGDDLYKNMINSHYKKLTECRSDEWIYSSGGENSPVHDDAAWTAMLLMAAYKTGSGKHALELAKRTVEEAYKYFSYNNDPENGLFYGKYNPNSTENTKSVYCVGILLSALKIYEISLKDGMPEEDLFADSLGLYEWVEENLLRDGTKEFVKGGQTVVCDCDDMLYHVDYIENRERSDAYPKNYADPARYGATSMFGNMGMAVIHKKLYDITGEEKYLERAVRTANAIAEYYNYKGTLINDRDAWTNTTFIGYFTSEVLTLDGVHVFKLASALYKTSYAIVKNCYWEKGYYSAKWNDSKNWDQGFSVYGNPIMVMTSANTVQVIFAAYLADKLGFVDAEGVDYSYALDKIEPQESYGVWEVAEEAQIWYKYANAEN